MTRDEQKAITAFIARTAAAGQPEMDVEADAIIRALLVRNPEAAYRITMLAMRQEAAATTLSADGPSLCPRPARGAKGAGGWLSAVLKRDDRRAPAKI